MTARCRALLVVALAPVAAACDGMLLAPTPGDDPESVARAAWAEIDAYHPFFERTGLDWNAVADAYLPLVGPGTTNAQLYQVLSDMIDELRDGHAGLRAPMGDHAWTGWRDGRAENFDAAVLSSYLRPPTGSTNGGVVSWGLLDGGWGYLRITSFGAPGIGESVDFALGYVGSAPGLVIDIRGNGGGSDTQSDAAAGRFVPSRLHYRTHRYKTGPGHGDFGPEVDDFVEPVGARRYSGPIVVLQNRRVFSAAEDFVLAMRVRGGVSFVGDSTGGGSGNPIARELPNGWVLRVSRWQAWAADGTWYEGIGLAPDVLESISPADVTAGRDPILERAIVQLGG